MEATAVTAAARLGPATRWAATAGIGPPTPSGIRRRPRAEDQRRRLFFYGGGIGFGGFSALIGLVNLLLGLAAFVLWIFMSIQGYQPNHLKLPVVGDYAERWAAAQT